MSRDGFPTMKTLCLFSPYRRTISHTFRGHCRPLRLAAAVLAPALAAVLSACAPLYPPPGSDDYSDSFQPGEVRAQDLPAGTWPTTATLPMQKPAPVAPQGALQLSVDDAILLALENNQSFQMQRLQPAIRRTFEGEARAAFDPLLTAGIQGSRTRVESETDTGQDVHTITERVQSNVGISEFLPTGTDISLDATTNRTDTSLSGNQNATRTGLSVTQALLRGAGLGPNLASLRQARLDTRSSEYELRGIAEQTIADVEETYWDYTLATRQIEIVQQALDVAQRQLHEAEERVKVGKLPESELYASRAEVALRRENMINARSVLAQTRLRLLRLLNPPSYDLWQRDLVLLEKPGPVDIELGDVEDHVSVAMRWRPDLNQARLQIERGDLELVKTRNGLLPVLDAFIDLGKTGYSDSFKGSVEDIDNDSYDVTVGASFAYPLFNRAAQSRHQRAQINHLLDYQSLANLEQLAQVDVRSAYIEVNRTREQVTATAATLRFQEESLRVENEKFRLGKSTSILVAQAQRDLLVSQISEVQAIVNHHHAVVELYRLEGTLLERRGIEAPGSEPVELPGEDSPALGIE